MFRCPKTWSSLEGTDDPGVRFCATCKKNVYYCDTLELLEEHRAAGHCIVVEDRTAETEEAQYWMGEVE
jgi:hypothetical protein